MKEVAPGHFAACHLREGTPVMSMDDTELCYTGAKKLARMIRARKVSATEVMRAFIARIERVNPKVNAIVTFLPEEALKEAKAVDRKGAAAGPLAGLPIAHKDIVPTKGMRTTFGSPIYRDHVPGEDHAIVERLRAAGAILLGKTNTPEFAVGSQTFNPVFGATRNPYDLAKTCGGSSGGAAVAVACGMLPFADGSDLGASLRNPAASATWWAFARRRAACPTGRSRTRGTRCWSIGPIARTVEDAALLFSRDGRARSARADYASPKPGSAFARPLARDFRKVRVAWSRDLGGLPVDARVTRVLEARRDVFEALGCIVEEAEPDLAGADEAFQVLRAVGLRRSATARCWRRTASSMKDTVVWNIEQGLAARRGARSRSQRAALARLPRDARVPRALRVPAAAPVTRCRRSRSTSPT